MSRIGIPMIVLILLTSIALWSATPAIAQSGGDYELTSSSVDGGGGTSSGGSYSLHGTSGGSDAGAGLSGGSYSMEGGFWNSSTGGPTVIALSFFSVRSNPGLKGASSWPWLVGAAALILGSILWVRRRLRWKRG